MQKIHKKCMKAALNHLFYIKNSKKLIFFQGKRKKTKATDFLKIS